MILIRLVFNALIYALMCFRARHYRRMGYGVMLEIGRPILARI